MSVDKKVFGITDSLIQAVNEALKGGQAKLDKNHNGKLDADDFKKLRNEGPEEKDVTNPKQGSSVNPKQREIDEAIVAAKTAMQDKIAQKQQNNLQSKANKRLNLNAGNCKCEGKGPCQCDDNDADDKKVKGGKEPIEVNPPMKESTDLPKKVVSKGHEIAKSLIKHRANVKSPYAVGMATAKKSAGIKEEAEQVDEVSTGLAHRAAIKAWSKADQMRSDAKKEPDIHSYANKMHKSGKKAQQGNKFIRYAQGMKEETEQVDELSRGTMNSYVRKSHNQTLGVDAVGFGTKKSGIPGHYRGKNKDLGKDPAHKAKMRKAGQALAIKKLNKEEVTQVDEISAMKAIRTAVKRQSAAHGAAIERGDEPNSKEQHKINRSQALIKKKYGEKGDKIVHKAVGKRIGYED